MGRQATQVSSSTPSSTKWHSVPISQCTEHLRSHPATLPQRSRIAPAPLHGGIYTKYKYICSSVCFFFYFLSSCSSCSSSSSIFEFLSFLFRSFFLHHFAFFHEHTKCLNNCHN